MKGLSSAILLSTLSEALVVSASYILLRDEAYIRLREVPQRRDLISPRADFFGGWALSANSCPKDTPTVCSNHGCCKSDQFCQINSLLGAVACCPDKNDCDSTLRSIPVCADPSWVLYDGTSHQFCCKAGQVGVLPTNGVSNGICVESGVAVPQSLIATRLSVATGAAQNPANTISGAVPTGGSSGGSSSGSGSGSGSGSSSGSGSGSGSGSSSGATDGGSNSGGSSSGSNTSSSGGSKGISGGVIGGIVGGVVVLLIAVGALFFFLGRRRGQAQAAPNPPPGQFYGAPAPAPPPAPVPQMQQQQGQSVPQTPAPYYDQISPPPRGPYAPPQHPGTPPVAGYDPNKDIVNVQQQQFPELGAGGDKWTQPGSNEMPVEPARHQSPHVRHEMQ